MVPKEVRGLSKLLRFIWISFHGTPFNSCWDMFVWTKVLDKPTLAPKKKKKTWKRNYERPPTRCDVLSEFLDMMICAEQVTRSPLVSKIIWRPFATLFLQLGLFCWGNFDIKFWDYLCRTHKCFKCGLNPLLQTRNSSHTCNVCAWWWLAGCQLWVLCVQILTEHMRQQLAKCLSVLTLWVCLDVSWTKGF